MKPTKTQIALAYIASISLMPMVFHRPIGLADYSELIFGVIWLLALVAFFLLRRRQKAALSVNGATLSKPSRPNKKIMWLSLVLIIVASLSSFFWLRYTGVTVSHSQLIMISITS
jgi:MYXO-CTERM domain-containing protein